MILRKLKTVIAISLFTGLALVADPKPLTPEDKESIRKAQINLLVRTNELALSDVQRNHAAAQQELNGVVQKVLAKYSVKLTEYTFDENLNWRKVEPPKPTAGANGPVAQK